MSCMPVTNARPATRCLMELAPARVQSLMSPNRSFVSVRLFAVHTTAELFFCQGCPSNCGTCQSHAGSCLSCIGGTSLYQGTCVQRCPTGTWSSNAICVTSCPSATIANNATAACQGAHLLQVYNPAALVLQHVRSAVFNVLSRAAFNARRPHPICSVGSASLSARAT